MTRLSPRTALRRTGSGLAAAGLLTAGSLALGAPAQAADPVLTLGGPAATALHPFPEDGSPRSSSLTLTVDDPAQDGSGYEGEVTYTVDLGGIAGIADVSVAEDTGADCRITGATAVCRDQGVHPGSVADFDLTAAEGGAEGATGTVTVTGAADGVTFTPFSTEVTIGGPDLVMKRLPFEQTLVPGDVQPAPITFANEGTTAADGVLLTLVYSRGLEIPERYANCEYSDGAGQRSPGAFAWSTALCSVEGAYEPGAVYTLAVPLSVEATERAYLDTFVYRIAEDSASQRSAQRAGAPFTRGTGPELALKKVTASARGADLDPRDNQQEADFRTENTADFVATGGRRTGSVGETVTAEVGFRNEGPAWIGHLRSGEPVAAVDFTVPEGAEVTGKPASCKGVTATGAYREQQLGAPRYVCDTAMAVRDGAETGLPFALRITEVVPDATGAVTVRNTRLAAPGLPFDPEPANNTAQLVLNPVKASGDTGGTSHGTTGTSGSTGGDTPGSTSGTSGSPGASSTSGSTGSHLSAGPASADTGGGLASTGSVALTASVAAAMALVAGGVLYVTTRRRVGRG
ncbi:peptidase [Streptomyces clavifer]|uniref:peptidase n=1 Tax=Streptomyces clavifer TaxID=68188 RepID=UPI002E811248|nr:peptidase [Streptomyces clavifer]WUC29519.1 peptidase [Streptomyces clavifer]